MIINPTYTTICNTPATGRFTILDCPRAINAMFARRAFGLSFRSTSTPNFMFLIIFFTLDAKKPKPAIRSIANKILSK
ncbi:hypothetical protein D3C85_871570 [compost metagenome]